MNEAVQYKLIDSPLGKLMLGATEQGCCCCEFIESEGIDSIKQHINKLFGLDLVKGTNNHIEQIQAELNLYFDKKLEIFQTRLHIQGTPFQEKVWQALLEIPYGETRSYGYIAKKIGNPSAMRAVGNANKHNILPIIIPCHRVIDASGRLGGYAGGGWRKQYLLDLESKNLRLF